ncbi:MAG: hypothetical protein KBE65_19175 [Phycisphaerae bacterium]|nr:hypothetical protein [Phycisphaerae bacterium]
MVVTLIAEGKGDFWTPDLQRWAGDIGRMIRVDGRTPERIEAVIRWCAKDPFWSKNILSAASLRKHFDRLELVRSRRRASATAWPAWSVGRRREGSPPVTPPAWCPFSHVSFASHLPSRLSFPRKRESIHQVASNPAASGFLRSQE